VPTSQPCPHIELTSSGGSQTADLNLVWKNAASIGFGVPSFEDIGKGSTGNVFLGTGRDKLLFAAKVALAGRVSGHLAELKLMRSLREFDLGPGVCKLLGSASVVQSSFGSRFRNSSIRPSVKTLCSVGFMTTLQKQAGSNKLLCDVSVPDMLDYFPQLVEALNVLHSHFVNHNDIKEHNILYCFATKRLMLIDFSNASVLSRLDRFQRGTPCYESPEQALSCKTLFSDRSDIYAVGILLLRFLFGGSILMPRHTRGPSCEQRSLCAAWLLHLAGSSLEQFAKTCKCIDPTKTHTHLKSKLFEDAFRSGKIDNCRFGNMSCHGNSCNQVKALYNIAQKCLAPSPSSRPSALELTNLFLQGQSPRTYALCFLLTGSPWAVRRCGEDSCGEDKPKWFFCDTNTPVSTRGGHLELGIPPFR
jgi:serine/threonine protein kinase